MMINAVLITAAGMSERFGKKKEYLSFPERKTASVLSQSVYKFAAMPAFSHILVTVPKGHSKKVETLLHSDTDLQYLLSNLPVTIIITEGAETRQQSVYTGLEYLARILPQKPMYILIHDGARPWISEKLISTVITAAKKYHAVVPVVSVTDTQIEIDKTEKVIRHLKRDSIAAVQTPQAFLFSKLLNAHRCAKNDGRIYTDDSEIYATYEEAVYICCGERSNKKITYPEDLKYQ